MVLFEIHGLHRITKEQGPEASAVLRRVAAQLIKASLREIDQVTRLGDDLFMVMLAGEKLSDAQELASRAFVGKRNRDYFRGKRPRPACG